MRYPSGNLYLFSHSRPPPALQAPRRLPPSSPPPATIRPTPIPVSTAAVNITTTTSPHTALADATASEVSSTSNASTSSDVDSVHACLPNTSAWSVHRTEIGEPVAGAPTHSRSIHLNCLRFTRTFTHRVDLLGHMRIHENLR
nr:unnamed protein product [Spirometra erinaceieuropaei]